MTPASTQTRRRSSLGMAWSRISRNSSGGARLTSAAATMIARNPKIIRRYGRSDEHTSELQSLMRISYAVFCLKKKQHYKLQTIDRNSKTAFDKPHNQHT